MSEAEYKSEVWTPLLKAEQWDASCEEFGEN